MENFHKRLEELIEKISFLESRRIKIGRFLKEINDSFKIGPNEEIVDEKIINKVPVQSFNKLEVLGVDGGIIKHSYHGLDLMLMRAAAVKFEYEEGKLKDAKYYPNSKPTPDPRVILDSFSDIELNSCYNFERQIMEVAATIESIEKLRPDIALMDGSIIPHYVPKPDNPILKEYYDNLVKIYGNLFDVAKRKKIILAGVIEDSRGIKFCDIINRRLISQIDSEIAKELKLIVEKTKDSNLLYYALEKGERTCVFNYSQNPLVHPVLKEFENTNNSFYSFYLKTVDFDRPIRVDFIASENVKEVADKLSSILIQTSGHSGYGMPAVLIEADQRAKLTENDMDMFYFDLMNRIGNVSTLFKMRREMRPF